MKRQIILWFCCSYYCFLFAQQPTLYLDGDTLCPGQTYEKAIRVIDFTEIRSYQFQLEWNPAVLILDSLWAAPPFEAGILVNTQQIDQGKFNVVWFYQVLLEGLSLSDGAPLIYLRYHLNDNRFESSEVVFDTTDQSFPFLFTQIINDSTQQVDGIGLGDRIEFSAPNVIDVNIAATEPGQASGSITLDVEKGKPPYRIDWGANRFGAQIENLSAGTYFCTVTDANDCQREFGPFEVMEITTSIDNISSGPAVILFPNPVSDYLTIKSEALITNLQLFSIQGQSLWQIDTACYEKLLKREISDLPAGVYYLHIRFKNNQSICKKIVL